MELVTEVERAVEHYCQGMSHLGHQLPLPGPPQVLLVTHRRPAPGAAPAEAVVQGHPSWGVTVPAPASWDSAPSADPQVLALGGGLLCLSSAHFSTLLENHSRLMFSRT